MKCLGWNFPETERQPKMNPADRYPHAHEKSRPREGFTRHQGLVIGVISLFWLILKTGRKPSRIQYPCQQTALANVSIFLLPPLVYLLYRLWAGLHRHLGGKQLLRLSGVVALASLLIALGLLRLARLRRPEDKRALPETSRHGPFRQTGSGRFGRFRRALFDRPPCHGPGIAAPCRFGP